MEDLLQQQWSPSIAVTGAQFLIVGGTLYALALTLCYLFEASPTESKSVTALRVLTEFARAPIQGSRRRLPPRERLALLTISLKGFFGPLMALSMFDFARQLVANAGYLLANAATIPSNFIVIFNSHGFWFLFQAILFVDVFFFTIGYLVEHPTLKNQIRSVDPTWSGWLVALACYPPFNLITVKLLGGNVADFPQFEEPAVHLVVNGTLLLLMAIYASASVALNFKASNLTHRGIVGWGPYRVVRHPAYVCKNLAWWFAVVPTVSAAWSESVISALLVIGASTAWTALYVIRALTEEDHLRRVDDEYGAYCRKVPYRFIPGAF